MNYIIYDQITGEILRTIVCPESIITLQIQEGELFIEGTANDFTQYIENSQLKDYTEGELNLKSNPPYGFKWKMPEKQVVQYLSDESIYKYYENKVLVVQNQLLSETNWTQTDDQSEVTKNMWKPYREALRNIKYQTGYPTNVVWPDKLY